jgi:hypothetical protein
VKLNFPGAFSSEVDPGSRKENAPKQEAPNENGRPNGGRFYFIAG